MANDPGAATVNAATLNRAIDQVGLNNGGGTICLPAGRFHLGFANGFPPRPTIFTAINIGRDNITLWGEGRESTFLLTPPDFTLDANGQVRRGFGLMISGTLAPAAPRRGIVLRGFELDGQAGWTGNYNFPANPSTGDGWDVTHKGIVVSSDTRVDDVVIEDVRVRRYKGEMIYAGGFDMGKLRLTRVISEDTNASTYNVTAEAVVEDSTFGLSRFWIEIGTAGANKSGIFRNNTFRDARGATGIAFAQGDGGVQPYTFTGNRFESCAASVFGFYGGVGGPITIQDNTVRNCQGFFLETGFAPNTVNPNLITNVNVTARSNTADQVLGLANFFSQARNFELSDNVVTGRANSTAVLYGAVTANNVRIVRNRFNNIRTPEQTADINGGTRPFFASNTYTNVERRELQGVWFLRPGSTVATPRFEEIFLFSNSGAIIAALTATQYTDGQPLTVRGGDVANPVIFAVGGVGYRVLAERRLIGSQTLRLEYSSANQRWEEVGFEG